jgi:crotonobetainyl-CoA:carnitine CoA-transferase CaiB-like acyl-CoA transferase
MMIKPLEGLTVLSIEQFAAGPYGSMYLADMGADVIKIENKDIGGDPSRFMGPYFLSEGDSMVFQGWNTNKQSVFIDMKTEEGRAIFEKLVQKADAVVNNLRGDQPAKLKIDYPNLKHIKKDLVCLHISAYGRDNSRTAWPGYDYLMQAESGLMHLTGDPNGDPARSGASMIDYMTGVTGMLGLLAAVNKAKKTGEGCDVDVSLFDVALHQLSYAGTWYMNKGLESGRLPRGSHLSVTPVQTFPSSDGWIYVMCMSDKFWLAMLDAIEAPELAHDDRFKTQKLRAENRDELTAVLDAVFKQKTTDHWLSVLRGVLPIAPVLTVKQAFENPFLDEIDMVRSVPHAKDPNMKLLGNPIKFDGQRLSQQPCRPLVTELESTGGAQ